MIAGSVWETLSQTSEPCAKSQHLCPYPNAAPTNLLSSSHPNHPHSPSTSTSELWNTQTFLRTSTVLPPAFSLLLHPVCLFPPCLPAHLWSFPCSPSGSFPCCFFLSQPSALLFSSRHPESTHMETAGLAPQGSAAKGVIKDKGPARIPGVQKWHSCSEHHFI